MQLWHLLLLLELDGYYNFNTQLNHNAQQTYLLSWYSTH